MASLEAEEHTEENQDVVEIFRKDYKPLPFNVKNIFMNIQIYEDKTLVSSTLQFKLSSKEKLVLNGCPDIKLQSIQINGEELKVGEDYTLSEQELVLLSPPSMEFTLETVVQIHPETNTKLTGLYKSSEGLYSTQCEAMGFRRITYFPDRPDNMSTYKVRLEASKQSCPVLLSNGNLVEEGAVGEDRHYAIWHDPFLKPSYLFAVVAGTLSKLSSTFTTKSGRCVQLDVYTEPENVHQLNFAMDSLKKSMKWDEETFGLEYDLDLFNIVAVADFNMGAMENKSLNIFNTAYLLTSPQTSTDTDYEYVLAVVGHEYFHNWTGNRVTCRDWFQLTLKEGLTVYREQEFSSDFMDSPSVKRIEDVKIVRAQQFPEDAGPMKHPIRPDSYISMDNFYTATVYEKGAEVIRMYATLLGKEGFRKGMDLYFERHDGTGVTCDDFRNAMADANGVDLTQFGLWYQTPGTPVVKYQAKFENGTLTLRFTQESLSEDGPLHIPIAVGVLNKENGEEIVPTTTLELKEISQIFTFDNLQAQDVVPSILRNFSAPIKLIFEENDSQNQDMWSFLAAYDTDDFNKWEAGQKLFTSAIFKCMDEELDENTKQSIYNAFGRTLSQSSSGNYSISAYALTLPSESELGEEMAPPVDPVKIHTARNTIRTLLARQFQSDIQSSYNHLTEMQLKEPFTDEKGEYNFNPTSIGCRRLRNVLLAYLCSISDTPDEKESCAQLAFTHFTQATNMTDKVAALSNLVSMEGMAQRDTAIQQFYNDANNDALVLNKWFAVQARADAPHVLDQVKTLTQHPDFTYSNPNRFRSLISAFVGNQAAFHAADGEGYRFIGKVAADIDKLNPTISARVARALIKWRRFDEGRGKVMKEELEKLKVMEGVSHDMYEIVTKGLQ